MKYILIPFFFFSIQTIFSQEQIKFIDNDSIITWGINKQLKWEDFSGEVNMDIIANSSTSYKIEIIPRNVIVDLDDNIQNVEQLTVVAEFFKKKSWTVSENKFLLKHEQFHFNIAELYARKIRQRFSELKKQGETRFSIYSSEYNKLWLECRKYQNQYDKETNHGRAISENEMWFVAIENELKKLDLYSLNPVLK